MVIRHSVKDLLAKNTVMWPMKYIVVNAMFKKIDNAMINLCELDRLNRRIFFIYIYLR